ncbi:hypothetical protein TOPH_09191, partial [Tolypocladium ophioglossoides CBS 100239]
QLALSSTVELEATIIPERGARRGRSTIVGVGKGYLVVVDKCFRGEGEDNLGYIKYIYEPGRRSLLYATEYNK